MSGQRKKSGQSVGLRQVAKLAGVSTATVSRAINTPDIVSPELRERIDSAIEILGWVPDGVAKALVTRRSHAIGAVFPTLSVGDFARATSAVGSELEELGYTLLLACSQYDADQEFRQIRKLVERGVDGLILVGRSHHPDLQSFLEKQRVPYVYSFIYDGRDRGTCIGPDNRKAMMELTRYLVDLGHRHVAIIAQSIDNNDRAQARLEGIRDALALRGQAVRPQHLAIGHWTIDEGRKLFRQVWNTSPRPTAVICGNAHLAVGAMIEAQVQNISVPAELSIVSYDDIEIMSHLPVPITALRVPSEDVGRHAARYVIAQVENRPLDIVYEHVPQLLIRASSGPPPKRRAQ